MPRKLILDHEFYCCKCGGRGLSVVRLVGKERESGHLKKLFCFNCGVETNFVECVPYGKYDYDNFLEEYLGGNFDENGKRILPYGKFKNKMIKEKKWDALQEQVDKYVEGVEET